MNNLQKHILKVYKSFYKICDENNLRFFAIGGTCIGAIRHKGFIPWDDDLDVAMPIDDFFKFRQIMLKRNDSKYKLIDYEDGLRFTLFLKLHDETTTFIENIDTFDKKRYKGIFIDIFPLVGVPKDKTLSSKYINEISYCYEKNYSFNLGFKERNGFSKFKYPLIKTYSLLIGRNYYAKKYSKLLSKYHICDDNNILFPWRYPVLGNYCGIFPYEDFSDSILVDFEDTKIYVPINYDDYLTKDFGDYMTLPPIEKRVSVHNVAKINLNKSYKYYLNKKLV